MVIKIKKRYYLISIAFCLLAIYTVLKMSLRYNSYNNSGLASYQILPFMTSATLIFVILLILIGLALLLIIDTISTAKAKRNK